MGFQEIINHQTDDEVGSRHFSETKVYSTQRSVIKGTKLPTLSSLFLGSKKKRNIPCFIAFLFIAVHRWHIFYKLNTRPSTSQMVTTPFSVRPTLQRRPNPLALPGLQGRHCPEAERSQFSQMGVNELAGIQDLLRTISKFVSLFHSYLAPFSLKHAKSSLLARNFLEHLSVSWLCQSQSCLRAFEPSAPSACKAPLALDPFLCWISLLSSDLKRQILCELLTDAQTSSCSLVSRSGNVL